MAKIGVFDSGLGGLTILKELLLSFPEEDFVYLGDTARLPYGTKSPETIRKYSEQIMNFLCTKNVDALVIACNSASSQVPEKEWHGLPLFNVIEPGAAKAYQLSQNKKIGLLGTRATVASESYTREIEKLDPSIELFSQACPLFVPLAEEGWTDDPITNLIVYRYLQPLLAKQIDTLILGCTHYPLLRNSIQRACGPNINLVDSGKGLAHEISQAFDKKQIIARNQSSRPNKNIEILMTDFSQHSQEMAESILLAQTQADLHLQFEIVQL